MNQSLDVETTENGFFVHLRNYKDGSRNVDTMKTWSFESAKALSEFVLAWGKENTATTGDKEEITVEFIDVNTGHGTIHAYSSNNEDGLLGKDLVCVEIQDEGTEGVSLDKKSARKLGEHLIKLSEEE